MDNPHDKLFRFAFGDPKEAAPLLRSILPRALSETLEWSTLTLVSGAFVSEALEERRSDLLFSVEDTSGETHLIYLLLEHQTLPDPMMAARMYEYVALILSEWRRAHPEAKLLPRVVPIVLYSGTRPWRAPTAVEELFDADRAEPWMPRMSFLLEVLGEASDQDLARKALRAFGELSLRALARLPKSEDPVAEITGWVPLLLLMLRESNGLARLRALIEYLSRVADVEPEALQPVVRQLGPAAEETAMTLAERLMERGRAQGARKGQIKLLLKMLGLRFGTLPPEISARLEAGTEADLERWAERLLVASSLEAVFEGDS